MIGNPVGHIRLKDAVEFLASKLIECASLPLPADVPRILAEAFERGAALAVYRESRGIKPLDPETWHSPAWRYYFETGGVELVLPLLDDKGQPHPQGFTARCTCQIFVRQDDLNKLIVSFGTSVTFVEGPRPAPESVTLKEIRTVYNDPASDRPNVNELANFVQPRLQALGFYASARSIRELGERDEFKALRRPPGKTKASERK